MSSQDQDQGSKAGLVVAFGAVALAVMRFGQLFTQGFIFLLKLGQGGRFFSHRFS